ncbi:helix-turn-helix domain-containing protein [Vibrio parahaemolyticus]|uniref:helix-turn-helix domain-containing protein n=1 Tax=Vibrio parahaemolyticus TaxID=670 RepID=UPI00111FF2A7|nr:helix-turn-helix transcriptional regulator [Vibrio parahaemolyticus]EGQ8192774.1 helix-turn-helix transcriptional regulator [Vibrio parahaemolyticus]EJB8441296.1 helix-turn-helix transcriptional regulator [Vibrio parahaemolyticus]EJB8452198.1 helix-turn-helix transcriptional regulator [Vibrio parahaemolyticus]ELA9292056.1 helix-turn-helix transcriptional regulator [Vibrio parahaemolyticus]MBE4451324.1 helix-turn-helix transcriptional regulator [Vibrio parahaemolyticus]
MNNLAKEISKNIAAQRQRCGLSSTEASLKAGFSRSYLSKVEKDCVRITVEKLYQLARVLDCEVTDLLPKDRSDLLD